MDKIEKQMRDILPDRGVWTISDFAIYLGMKASDVQEHLSEIGVKTIHFGREYKRRIFRLEDLK